MGEGEGRGEWGVGEGRRERGEGSGRGEWERGDKIGERDREGRRKELHMLGVRFCHSYGQCRPVWLLRPNPFRGHCLERPVRQRTVTACP